MEDSILDSIKKMLGIPQDYDHYDTDVIIHINSVFSVLDQLGIDSFAVYDSSAKWSDYIPIGLPLDSIKSYVYLKVKLLFDPPSSSTAIEAIKNQISEFEWRIKIAAEDI